MKLTTKHRERFVRKGRIFQGNAVGFRMDHVRIPGGGVRQREYMTHPGAVGALALSGKNKILLVKQYRYPVGEFTYEIPAGKLGKRENPLSCMKRELEEETGHRAKKIVKLLSFWPTAAFSDEVIHLYLATDLIATQAHPDDDEFLELVEFSPAQIEKLIRSGKIRDSKTLIAYLAWKSL